MAISGNGQNNKRSHARIGIGAPLPIHIVRLGDGACIACRVSDASSSGMGVLIDVELSLGEAMVFKTVRKAYRMTVTWCERAERGFKCGLELDDPGQDLDALFSAYRHYKAAV